MLTFCFIMSILFAVVLLSFSAMLIIVCMKQRKLNNQCKDFIYELEETQKGLVLNDKEEK